MIALFFLKTKRKVRTPGVPVELVMTVGNAHQV